MKILLVCAGGMSTSVVMNKLKKYADEKGIEMEINAVGMNELLNEVKKGYDCVLLGPQVTYQINSVKKMVDLPVAAIKAQDYGLANCENIMALIKSTIK